MGRVFTPSHTFLDEPHEKKFKPNKYTIDAGIFAGINFYKAGYDELSSISCSDNELDPLHN